MRKKPNPTISMKKKTLKDTRCWAVVWPYQKDSKFITPAHHSTDAAALFSTYKRAKRFADSYTNASVMKVIRATITYELS